MQLIKPISKGLWNLKNFNERIYSNIEKESYIIPYGDRYLSLVARFHNKKSIKEINDEHRIKFLRSNLNKWLRGFYGIATKLFTGIFVLFYII